jgi:hypothetical protein
MTRTTASCKEVISPNVAGTLGSPILWPCFTNIKRIYRHRDEDDDKCIQGPRQKRISRLQKRQKRKEPFIQAGSVMPRPRPAACCCCACCCAIPSPLASTAFSQTLSLSLSLSLSLRRALFVSLFLSLSLSLSLSVQRECSGDTMGYSLWCPKARRKKCLRGNPIFRGTFSFRCLEEARRRKEMKP